MNVLEQLQALGFREVPLQFYDGGDTNGDPSGGAGPGPGGTDVGAENTADYGGPSSAEIAAADAIASLGLNAGKAGQTVESMAAEDIIGGIMARGGASVPGAATKSDLQSLANLGYGKMEGLNTKNPSQTVENLIASANVHAAVPVALSFMPGAGLVKTAQTVGGLLSGQTSIGQAVATLGLGVVANQLGVSPGMLNSLISGNLGQIVSNVTMAQAPAAVNAILGVTGLGSKIGSGIASTINEQLGITPIDTLGTIGRSIDQSFGLTPGAGGAPGFTHTGEFSLDGGQGAATGGGESGVAPGGGKEGTQPDATGESAGFDLSGLAPLFTVAALEDILTPKEKEEQEQARTKTPVSPFGTIPYE